MVNMPAVCVVIVMCPSLLNSAVVEGLEFFSFWSGPEVLWRVGVMEQLADLRSVLGRSPVHRAKIAEQNSCKTCQFDWSLRVAAFRPSGFGCNTLIVAEKALFKSLVSD